MPERGPCPEPEGREGEFAVFYDEFFSWGPKAVPDDENNRGWKKCDFIEIYL